MKKPNKTVVLLEAIAKFVEILALVEYRLELCEEAMCALTLTHL
jgi:hypothetical protein